MSAGHSERKQKENVLGHPELFWETGGKCLLVILSNFGKREKNVPWSFWAILGNGRKMSAGHSEQFWETGGNCPLVILSSFGKQE